MIKKIIILTLLLFVQIAVMAQSKPFVSHPSQLDDDRFAEWIAPSENIGVFYFRKTIDINPVPDKFVVHVSADARYRLYVNGHLASWGPAVGDVENWNYETVDIAPYLQQGKNLIASQVWNWGSLNGAKQQSVKTAFILQGDTDPERIANTNSTWRVSKDPGYFVLPMDDKTVGGGYIAGSTDSVYAKMHPWGWNLLQFDDSTWALAIESGKGNHTGLDTWKGTTWKLKERELPPMEQRDERTLNLLEVRGLSKQKTDLVNLEVPPNSRVEILLDNKVLTMGFPQLLVYGGEGSTIRIQYQESLFNEDGTKGNRNEWKGKIMKGYYDVFVPDGGERLFEPLWIRVFRYVMITVETGDEPLRIVDFYNKYTAFPLQQKATFSTTNTTMKQIWEASWRTMQLCALESYMDCPYYEQVQYIGDTRIQALISMYVGNEDRLAKNAIQQFYNSMQPMGLTKSAHPTGGVQIIPPFSLVYIGMVHDYYKLRDDPDFVRQFIPGIKFILEWFIGRIDENGIMGPLPFWNHIDGGTDFVNGSPPGISDGGSAHMTILLAYALDKASIMLEAFGFECDVQRFQEISRELKQKTMELCFCDERNLIAETPEKRQFSQHTNIFAVLTDTYSPEMQKEIVQSIISDKSLIQTTLYFKFYLFQAMKKTGMGELILDMMDDWKKFLDYGFTTFPEHGINSRSDCHAWAAHPMYHFFHSVLGIGPSSAGFKTIEIRPAIGNLNEIAGTMPHPNGDISVHYKKTRRGKLECKVTLPKGLEGFLVYKNQSYILNEGPNQLVLDL